MKKALLIIPCAAILLAGVIFIGKGLFILAKACAAQIMLEDSWNKVLIGHKNTSPWPWADFKPVASLYFPKQHYRTIVVNSASTTSLAFAPGHLDGTSLPGTNGNAVVFGHRETHFGILKNVILGETIIVTDADGGNTEYRVIDLQIIDENDLDVLKQSEFNQLTLITCFPFDSLTTGPERYVVIADEVNQVFVSVN